MEHAPRRTARYLTSVASGLLLALGVLGGACSSSSGSPQDAGCKKSISGDCAWTPCDTSVADFCAAATAHGGVCVMDWPADPASFCSAYSPDDRLSTADCGSYRALSASGVDASATFYYDKATGKLVARVVYDAVFQTATCQGGPSDFVEPSCGSSQPLSCPDAGGTGGTGGSAGADAAP